MMSQESSLVPESYGTRIRLTTNKPCDQIQKKFGVLEFNIQSTKIQIMPEGYLFNDEGKCNIGIESIPDKLNQIRLGRMFLRNFYTVLDFDRDYIAFGLNLGGAEGKAFIGGQDEKGFTVKNLKSRGGLLGLFLIILTMCGGGFGYHFWKKRRDQRGIFARTTVVQQQDVSDKESPKDEEEQNQSEALLEQEDTQLDHEAEEPKENN
jgi:hypothetical protein